MRRRVYKKRRAQPRKRTRKTPRRSASHLEELLASMIRLHKLPAPEREYRFARSIGRKFAFDFAYPAYKIAAECEGGIWLRSGGRHTRGIGFQKDAEKYNLAVAMGWVVGRFTPAMIREGDAIDWLEHMLSLRGAL